MWAGKRLRHQIFLLLNHCTYFLREKIDDEFISNHENVSRESADVLVRNGETICGNGARDYADLITYVNSHDLSKTSNYEYVCSLMDVESYADFKIAQVYSANIDLHNSKYYKTDEGDGKWRWIFYDQDFAFRDLNNSVARTIMPGYNNVSHELIRALLKNKEFRNLYLSKFAYHLSNTFSDETVQNKINDIYNQIYTEMERNCQRWNLSFSSWKNNVESLKRTAVTRKKSILKELKTVLNLSENEYNKYFKDI